MLFFHANTMTWLFLSLATALSVAIRDISVKIFTKDLSPAEIGAAELFWSLPFLLTGSLFIPVPGLDSVFWWAFLISLPINWLAYILYLYAIKLSPISLTVPFLAFTPVFMILTGYLVLDETVNLWGKNGILLIVAGSYILNLEKASKGLFKPFTSLFHEKGSVLMLLVALIFSFAAVIGKQGMAHSSPLFFTYLFFITFNISLLLIFLISRKTNWRCLWSVRYKGGWLGSLLFAHVSFHGLAIMLTTAAYMIAIKRSSIIFAVILSWLILKEENIRFRFIGALTMFSGAVLIVLKG